MSFRIFVKGAPATRWVAACAMLFASAGCATHRYRPVPIAPAASADNLQRRALNDPGLHVFISRNFEHPPETWPPISWNPAALTLAGFYFHPDLRVARAGVKVAEAAIITAGARPNPSIGMAPGGSTA